MPVVRSLFLFVVAATAELAGAWLVWQGIRGNRGLLWVGLGVVASGLYPLAATLQHEPEFGRVVAAYGGVFIVVALVWAALIDGFRPDRYDLLGALLCLVGVVVIMFGRRFI